MIGNAEVNVQKLINSNMNLLVPLVIIAVIAVVLFLKHKSLVSVDVAREYLRRGALVIDVRSMEEYRGGHLPGTINIPLDEIGDRLPQQVKDKSKVLLLHCLSGTRSGEAMSRLQSLGYSNVYNLGSYSRARQIITGK